MLAEVGFMDRPFWSDSWSFTYHDESFVGSSVIGRSLPLARLHAHRGDIGVGVNGERVKVCLLLGKLTPRCGRLSL